MPTRSDPVRIADEPLGAERHVCALVDDAQDADRTLWPFILEGLEHGDRVIHLVEDRDAYRELLADRPEAGPAIDSGKLEVRLWSESYVPDGRFKSTRMLAELRRLLEEGPRRRGKGTRLIGDMGWATEDLPGVEELVAYEAKVDAMLGAPPNTVVCAYDVRRHSAARLASIMAVHQTVLVGGRLQRPGRARPSDPRDRILDAASRLFAESGFRATGIDRLIATAGVAKATFYRHFKSKDELIVAWLQDPRARWFDRIRAVAESRAASPADVIPEVFVAAAEWLAAEDFRGCPFLNTAIEIADPAHPASPVVREHLEEIERYLQEAAAAAGYRDAAAIGTALQMLLAGSITLGVAHRTDAFVLAARETAAQLLESAGRG